MCHDYFHLNNIIALLKGWWNLTQRRIWMKILGTLVGSIGEIQKRAFCLPWNVTICCLIWGFPGGTSDKEPPANAEDVRDTHWVPGLGRFPWRRQPTPVFWPGKSHGQMSLVGYSLWYFRESDTNEQHMQAHTRQTRYVWFFSYILLPKTLAGCGKCWARCSIVNAHFSHTIVQ